MALQDRQRYSQLTADYRISNSNKSKKNRLISELDLKQRQTSSKIPFLTVCTAIVPIIANGFLISGDPPPYFINEIITYQCNNNYDADGADLTNECMENTGVGVPAVWSRMTNDLISVCRAGI